MTTTANTSAARVGQFHVPPPTAARDRVTTASGYLLMVLTGDAGRQHERARQRDPGYLFTPPGRRCRPDRAWATMSLTSFISVGT
jgi:hypothetical protein